MSPATTAPREQLVAFRGEMLLFRRFEEKVTERFRAGELAQAGSDPEPRDALRGVHVEGR